VILALLAGCNRYDLFLVIDGSGGRAPDADLLFVIDNSQSMVEESVGLAESFGRFVTALERRGERYGTDGLGDAVEKYVDLVQDPGLFVDYQLAIATIDAPATGGALIGDPPLLRKETPDLADAFVRNLMCEATCFPDRAQVPSNPALQCDDPFDGQVTQEMLDCVCGVDQWIGHCGGSGEQGIETVLNAMCRAVVDPPPECFEEGVLVAADANTNAGLIRRDSTFIPVVITDEGDNSPRVPRVQAVPQKYYDLFGKVGIPMVWAVISPAMNEDFELVCPSTADSWGLMRYEYLADRTGGLHVDIHGEDCLEADWTSTLERLGDLVTGGSRSFPLPMPPVPTSIAVELDGRGVEEADSRGEDVFGAPIYTDGWTYEEESQSVLLHGDVAPKLGEEVRIWFWPAHLEP
jgi:hypothetical protein